MEEAAGHVEELTELARESSSPRAFIAASTARAVYEFSTGRHDVAFTRFEQALVKVRETPRGTPVLQMLIFIAIMDNIMFGPLEDSVGQPPTSPPPGFGRGRRRSISAKPAWAQLLLAAITSRHIAVAITIAGAVVVMVLHVFYAVVIQGWGSPLP